MGKGTKYERGKGAEKRERGEKKTKEMGWEWKRGIRKGKKKKKGKGEIGKGRGRGTCGMSCTHIMSSIPIM